MLLAAVILITAIPAVKDELTKLTNELGYISLRDHSSAYEVNIHFISTYSSDCILMECGEKYILIDGGYYGLYDDIDKYLQEVGVKEFAAVVNTHPDSDHLGALPYIIRDYPTDILYCSPISGYIEDIGNDLMLSTAKEAGVPTEFLSAGDEFMIDDYKFQVVAPYETGQETNPASLVIRVTKDDFSALFTGDSYKEELLEAAEMEYDLKADILKVPHHGSNTSITDEIVEFIDPQYAVVTVNRNRHGHPHEEVVKVFEERQIPLLLTEDNGTIIISSNCDGEYFIDSVHSGG